MSPTRLTYLTRLGTYQFQYPRTAFVPAGSFSKKVADHGITRCITITGFDIQSFTQRKWTEWNGRRYWHCTAVIGYHGITQNIPEGAAGTVKPPIDNFLEGALRNQLRLKSGL